MSYLSHCRRPSPGRRLSKRWTFHLWTRKRRPKKNCWHWPEKSVSTEMTGPPWPTIQKAWMKGSLKMIACWLLARTRSLINLFEAIQLGLGPILQAISHWRGVQHLPKQLQPKLWRLYEPSPFTVGGAPGSPCLKRCSTSSSVVSAEMVWMKMLGLTPQIISLGHLDWTGARSGYCEWRWGPGENPVLAQLCQAIIQSMVLGQVQTWVSGDITPSRNDDGRQTTLSKIMNALIK